MIKHSWIYCGVIVCLVFWAGTCLTSNSRVSVFYHKKELSSHNIPLAKNYNLPHELIDEERVLSKKGPAAHPPASEGFRSSKKEIPIVPLGELLDENLIQKTVPLNQAKTRPLPEKIHGSLGSWTNFNGYVEHFNPGILLVKFQNMAFTSVLRVEPYCEREALMILGKRDDLAYSCLDRLKTRQSSRGIFRPNDPSLVKQWHHDKIHSYAAWRFGMGHASIRIAIVDTPFQMDHPDLTPNAGPGWDVIDEKIVTEAKGINHSTLTAGFCSAVIHNNLGVAGIGSCQVIPINITGFVSEMYQAIVWAADHQVRVVNISWDGANEPALNDAGLILKTKTRGMLVMSGINDVGYLNYPAYPHIYAISMTDDADMQRSAHGEHIDFAAPGWDLFGPITAGLYGYDSGTSFATAIVSGVIGVLMSINPSLSPQEIEEILKATTSDLGQAGWDSYYGWGRIDFQAAAAKAASTVTQSIQISGIFPYSNGMAIKVPSLSSGSYVLWRKTNLHGDQWDWVRSSQIVNAQSSNLLVDPTIPLLQGFYEVQAVLSTSK